VESRGVGGAAVRLVMSGSRERVALEQHNGKKCERDVGGQD
jgi:hypothetical protein